MPSATSTSPTPPRSAAPGKRSRSAPRPGSGALQNLVIRRSVQRVRPVPGETAPGNPGGLHPVLGPRPETAHLQINVPPETEDEDELANSATAKRPVAGPLRRHPPPARSKRAYAWHRGGRSGELLGFPAWY